MNLAIAAGGSSTIRLPGGKDGKKVYALKNALPEVTTSLVITGDGEAKIWGPCTKAVREDEIGHCRSEFDNSIFSVAAKGTLKLSNLSVNGGWPKAFDRAGGITSSGTLELDRVTMVGNGAHNGAGSAHPGRRGLHRQQYHP